MCQSTGRIYPCILSLFGWSDVLPLVDACTQARRAAARVGWVYVGAFTALTEHPLSFTALKADQ
jgi:hypothetical protein